MKLHHLAVLVFVGVLILYMLENHREGIAPSGASPYNAGWDGISNLVDYLRTLGRVEIVQSWYSAPRVGEDYSCKVVFVISPEKRFREKEVRVIADLVRNRGYDLVILDEGPHSNDILKALGLPIRIEAFRFARVHTAGEPAIPRYHVRYGIARETPGFIELDGVHYVVFFYVSQISIEKPAHSRCRAVAYTAGGDTVGFLCYTQGGRVIAIGDSSIAINAVIPPTATENMYTLAIERVVKHLCGDSIGSASSTLFLVDSSKHRLRALAFSELAEEGYRGIEAAVLFLNPFRYLYACIANSEIPSLALLSASITTGFIAAVGYTARRRSRALEKPYRDVYTAKPSYGQSTIRLVVDLCRSDGDCLREAPCVLGDISRRCIKVLSRYVSGSRLFRRKIVERALGKG